MGTLDGVLFYQGENDALAGGHYNDWDVYFEQMVTDLRSDTSADLPIVFVQINNLPASFLYTTNVQASQASVSITGVSMVSAIGLPKIADNVHLTVAGQNTLGYNMANEMDALIP